MVDFGAEVDHRYKMTTANGAEEEHGGLGLVLRSLVGLERDAVSAAFDVSLPRAREDLARSAGFGVEMGAASKINRDGMTSVIPRSMRNAAKTRDWSDYPAPTPRT